MGYLTDWQIKVTVPYDEYSIEPIVDFLKEITEYDFSSFSKNYIRSTEAVKWYTFKEDLEKLSYEFPECTFLIAAGGEDGFDVSAYEICFGRVLWEWELSSSGGLPIEAIESICKALGVKK